MLLCHSHSDLELNPIDPKIHRDHLLSISDVCMKFNKRTMMVLYRSPECLVVMVDNPMFQLVILWAGPVLIPAASNEQTW